MINDKEQTFHVTRFPHGLAVGPTGGYDVAPVDAFKETLAGDMKEHSVIATGTKAECLRGARLIKQQERRTGKKVDIADALKLLEKAAEGSQSLDPSKCPRCQGEGKGFINRRQVKCFLCGGTGRKIP